MKRKFYKVVKENLLSKKDLFIFTILESVNDLDIGKKILKVDNEFIFEDERDREKYKEIIENLDLKETNKVFDINNSYKIMLEQIASKPKLVICGGGHISLELYKVAKMLDFNVIVIDDREEFANTERFPSADKVICKKFNEALEEINYDNNSYFVVVTRGHRADQICIESILNKEYKYLGMIGSKAKVANSVRQLVEKGYSSKEIEKIHAPIGLNIGAQTPAEIAISIAAQIIEIKNKSNLSNVDEKILNTINESNKKMVLVSILDKVGSSPRGVGAKMLVTDDKKLIGSIGGGSVENAAYEKALELIKQEKSYIESYDLSNSVAAKLGMTCGGTIKVLLEYIK